MRNGTIYGLICPISNSIRYIGQTVKSLKRRLSNHKTDTMGTSHKQRWLNKLLKLDLLDKLQIVELFVCDISQLDENETRLIKEHKEKGCLLTNTMSGGSGDYLLKAQVMKENKNRVGKKHSIETKKKISLAKKGTVPWNKGLATPDDVKKRQSESKKGKAKPSRSKEHCENIAKAKRQLWKQRREQGLTGRLGNDNKQAT